MPRETMIPIILDENFNLIGVIDDYISFIWTTRYYTVGDFELVVNVSPSKLALLQKNYYIQRLNTSDVGIISKINIVQNEDGQVTMTVLGQFLSSILGRRIISQQTQLNGTVGECVEQLITENVIAPTISARRIPRFVCGNFTNAPIKIERQFTGKNLLEAISDIAKTNGAGFRTILDNAAFIFEMYDGVDRSREQTANPWVIFSNEYNNLNSAEYEENYETIVTDVLVAGEGEGLDRKTIWTPTKQSGLYRYEVFADARNVSSDSGDGETEIPEATYLQQLQSDGLEYITQFATAFIGEIDFSSVVFGRDINIGDKCTIEDNNWGISVSARIVEVIESVSESGAYTVLPSFGI